MFSTPKNTAIPTYTFGSIMVSVSKGEYRYGFGGYEKDDDVKGEANHLSFGDYGYDPRIGRRWRPDPLESKYPSISPFVFCNSNPLYFIDIGGKDIIPTNMFVGTRYHKTVQNIIDNEDKILMGHKYLSTFMNEERHLYLQVHVMKALPVSLIDELGRPITPIVKVDFAKVVSDNTKTTLVANPMSLYINTNIEHEENDMLWVLEQTEICIAATIIHEVMFHAWRGKGDHLINSDMLFESIQSLQDYSKVILKKELSAEIASAINLIDFVDMSNFDDLLKKTNEKFDLNLNKDMVIKIGFDNAFNLVEVTNQEYNQTTLATQSESMKNQTNVSKMEKSSSSNEE